MKLLIRTAQADEAETLSALCKRSKAHWGYDAEFMRLSNASLTIAPILISTGRVIVAEDDALLGIASLEPLKDDTYDLLHMFVDPAAMGRGVGAALFAEIAARAKADGACALSILADPHAELFYIRMGAVRVGDAPSDAVPGRMLPLLSYRL